MTTYCASFSYRDKSTPLDREESSKIYYTAENKEAAIAAFKRWFDDRQRVFAHPDFEGIGCYEKLLAVKIFIFRPQPIDEKGRYELPTGMWAYEWKCDWGWGYGQ